MDEPSGELVDEILATAIWLMASDVHFDPFEDDIEVSFRIHGRLVEACQVSHIPNRVSKAAVQRLKVLARLSLGEQRRPQDGQLHMQTSHGSCDIRVATIPTVRGERMVARLIPEKVPWDSLHALGMSRVEEQIVRHALDLPGGLIVTGGRVGVGKSTTMHALLAERRMLGQSVLTIEDPVERRMQSYQQVEVDEHAGMGFADALRASLRQDPDVLMVGEIRDEQTAQIAVRAGMTGHLIITSVHADHASQVILRLLELGVAPRYVRDVLRLVIWQRLVPVVCEECSGQGCGSCLGLGVVGRRPEFELMSSLEVIDAVYHYIEDGGGTRGLDVVRRREGSRTRIAPPSGLYGLYHRHQLKTGRNSGGMTVAEQSEAKAHGYGVLSD